MPQREPLAPALLAFAGVVAAACAAWIALGAEAIVTGAVGSMAGFPWTGLALSPWFTPVVVQARVGHHPAGVWALMLLAGPVGAAGLGLACHAVVQAVRVPTWVRAVAFQWSAFAVLRLPALLVAGALPGGRGPIDELYRRLGEPQSGRWSVAVLALLALWGAAALVARLAVGAGRDWMRVDGRTFRRRLVRVVAGIPALAALAAWSAVAPWASVPWMIAWLALTGVALHQLTP